MRGRQLKKLSLLLGRFSDLRFWSISVEYDELQIINTLDGFLFSDYKRCYSLFVWVSHS